MQQGSAAGLRQAPYTLQLLWRNNIDASQVVMGLGFYGRCGYLIALLRSLITRLTLHAAFILKDLSCTAAGCPFASGGNQGKCTASSGILSYNEIQDVVKGGAKVATDKDAAVKIATWDGDQWVSYDDMDTLKMKIDYANNHCLGG